MPDERQADSERWESYKRVVLQSIEELKVDVHDIQLEIARMQADLHRSSGGTFAVKEFITASIVAVGVIVAIVLGVVK